MQACNWTKQLTPELFFQNICALIFLRMFTGICFSKQIINDINYGYLMKDIE
jgi:hypothetical protein